ncbi:uncharacterized protein BKA55DRAFT_598521 [Fusarium redolens]|uniref:Uncharacterized protein n=1 Tax=Fusarium redolens TaxID=48865 RepID=A0A9P9JNP5_FUSRE|nr:uncharacterized protein BKA55DRAFT_598521 [Fusarium redolens]KAH7231852.1 hypothetical protein BKA55DRAFT_598521 [Fusarium redolens]
MGVTELDNPTSQFVFLRVILGYFMISRISAVRPAKAGVQIFSLSSDHRSQPHEDGVSEAPWVDAYYLTAPKWAFGPKSSRVNGFDEITVSWTKNNLSTYLIDSGLWSACRQSHCVMRDILGPTKPIAIRKKVRYDPDMFSRFLFEDVIPNNTAQGLLQIPHVGWQYHPSWASSLHESSRIRSLDSLCCYIVYGARFGGLETLWLINYRIKRKHWVSSKAEFDGPKPKVFKADEFQLVEVEIDDDIRSSEQLSWDEVLERGDPYTLDDFLAFVRLLRQLVTHTLLSTPALQTAKHIMSIKVLAYEDL